MSPISLTILTLAAIGIVGTVNAGSGEIDASAFGGKRTIVFSQTFECEDGIYGLVVKNDEWSFGVSGHGSVSLDRKIVENSWNLRGAPHHESEFIRKTFHDKDFTHLKEGSPEYEKLLKAAQEKDATHEKEVLAALAAEHKRAGLNADPDTEQIVYFSSGKAKMRILESLQGDLKPGNEIEVNWKHVQRTISCPPVIPFEGKCGWIFDSKLQNGAITSLGLGFFSLEEGRKAKAKFQRDGADQPATAPEAEPGGDDKPKSNPEARPR